MGYKTVEICDEEQETRNAVGAVILIIIAISVCCCVGVCCAGIFYRRKKKKDNKIKEKQEDTDYLNNIMGSQSAASQPANNFAETDMIGQPVQGIPMVDNSSSNMMMNAHPHGVQMTATTPVMEPPA